MYVSDVSRMLEEMYPLRSELVPCLIGAPGIGKTQGIQQFAREKGVKVVTFILSNTVPSEVSGIRMPDRDTKKLEVFDDSRMSSLEDGDILFFDEILEAQPALWSACLTLIQDRVMASGRTLPDVFIVAASNPVANPRVVPASVRDRFVFVDMQFGYDNWAEWMHERFGVRPVDSLRHILSQSGDVNWNIVSPRKVTKLVQWMLQPGDREFKHDFIADVMNAEVARAVLETAATKGKADVKKQIADKMIELGVELDVDLTSMSMRDILAIIEADPNADEIMAALQEMEVEE